MPHPELTKEVADDIMQRFYNAFPEFKTDPVYTDVGEALRESLDNALAKQTPSKIPEK